MSWSDERRWFRAAAVWCGLLALTLGAALVLGWHAHDRMGELIALGQALSDEAESVRARLLLSAFGGIGAVTICGTGFLFCLIRWLLEILGRDETRCRRVERP